MRTLFLFLLLIGSLYAKNFDAEHMTEYRLNQLEKELATIKAENQRLISGYEASAQSLNLQNMQKENSIEENASLHSSVVSKIFFFTTVFSGFWIFFVGIAGWMFMNKQSLCLVESY